MAKWAPIWRMWGNTQNDLLCTDTEAEKLLRAALASGEISSQEHGEPINRKEWLDQEEEAPDGITWFKRNFRDHDGVEGNRDEYVAWVQRNLAVKKHAGGRPTDPSNDYEGALLELARVYCNDNSGMDKEDMIDVMENWMNWKDGKSPDRRTLDKRAKRFLEVVVNNARKTSYPSYCKAAFPTLVDSHQSEPKGVCLEMVQKTFRSKSVCDIFVFSKSTLYEQINTGKFPPPNVHIGERAVGWTEDLLEAEQARRMARRESIGR